jgi:hypothetical protein
MGGHTVEVKRTGIYKPIGGIAYTSIPFLSIDVFALQVLQVAMHDVERY